MVLNTSHSLELQGMIFIFHRLLPHCVQKIELYVAETIDIQSVDGLKFLCLA